MKRIKPIEAADLFCGAGGASNGLMEAAVELGRPVNLTAINHWQVAIDTHSLNHPKAVHMCEDVASTNPRKAVPKGRLDLLLAGPECTHHSTARGGKPVNDQSRASAWCILRWATALHIDTILIENVKEFEGWGPLGQDGQPLKSRKGETFLAFINAIKALGYRVEWRVLCAADFGDPTTRERLFIQARRGRRPIVWPAASHSRNGSATLFGPTARWKPARDIIDWTIKAPSIFNRKRPLSPNTLARIAAGLKKFGGAAAEPFLVLLNGGGRMAPAGVRSVEDPLPTVTASGEHFGLVEPFMVQAGGPTGKARQPQSVNEPLRTLLTENHTALVEPFIAVVANSGDNEGRHRSIDQPLPTVTAGGNRFGLVEPFLIPQFSDSAPRSVDSPINTLTTTSRGLGLCEPFVLPPEGIHRGNAPRSIEDPLPTITSRGGGVLVEPFLMHVTHGGGHDRRTHDADKPFPTVTGSREIALVEPFVMGMSQSGSNGDRTRSADQPLATITTADDLAVVQPFLIPTGHGERDGQTPRTHSLDQPMPTLVGTGVHGLVEPFLVKFNGTAVHRAQDVEEPLDTVTGKDRHGLVEPAAYELDIRFRMLSPAELAAAHSFPATYIFTGNREQKVKMVGNSWPNKLGRALCLAILSS